MVYSCGRAALAVAQAVAYFTVAGCGGGDATDDSQAPQSDGQVQVQVEDRVHVLSAPAPSLNGGKITLHSATVSWTAPVQNTDGTPLTDVAGYVIRYGRTPTNLTRSIVVSDPGLTTGTVSGLQAGLNYFSVATRNSAGTLSTASSVVSKTIP